MSEKFYLKKIEQTNELLFLGRLATDFSPLTEGLFYLCLIDSKFIFTLSIIIF